MHYEFTPEIVGKTLYHRTERKVWKTAKGIKYRKTGCVLNFALFKKEVFNFIQWDEKQKISEHTDFYIRYKQLPYKIYYTPDVIIEHPPVQMKNEEYKEYRTRDEFQIKMMKKYDIIKIKYENGQVIELNDDMSLSHFREKPEEIEVFV